MFNVGDYALHQKTGQVGQVSGYGHQLTDGVYITTLKVKITKRQGTCQSTFVEDTYSTWTPIQAQ
ncbi:hypothetical protein VF14_16930 [Nostoc linckia z18]|uniref:Uncharacterized protein n=2 Tax=Nostoc linckia TaxID=92942 RepID=A0A9Q5ZD77_NOSLI|nr:MULTISPECIES: hypothetical protein [Nostoc]PHK32624.1 hypothetical protein VF12_26410 [Nostoc linckia z15]PHK45374.1 hypothetical protein VF13_16665 [Nostoc linckia z16]MBC1235832.1 hypothetical protein [Nostoc sp. 2RC]PHJ59243.1 hypothetical protein VF02_25510 [Nostoc linckia z1]PHJ69733.1 hypothetical protein VF03_23345 [Nostoc linckia z2]